MCKTFEKPASRAGEGLSSKKRWAGSWRRSGGPPGWPSFCSVLAGRPGEPPAVPTGFPVVSAASDAEVLLETPIAGDPRTFGSGKAVCSALSRSAPLHARYAAAGASGARTLKPGNTPTPHPPPPPCGWERCLLASVLRLFIPLRLPCSISHYQQNVVSKTGQPS